MSRKKPILGKKCQRCRVAAQIGGCLFGCNRKERLTRELKLLMAEAESRTDPLMELLRKCPEAFKVGRAVSAMLECRRRDSGVPIPPPSGVVMFTLA